MYSIVVRVEVGYVGSWGALFSDVSTPCAVLLFFFIMTREGLLHTVVGIDTAGCFDMLGGVYFPN